MRRSILLGFVLTAACSDNPALHHIPFDNSPSARTRAGGEPKRLAVFLDGTANDEASHTNVWKLYNLVTLQPATDISATYIKGVGTNMKVAGMATGWGIGHDVRQAYQYLGETYSERDTVLIFGFSRGAYAARILASLLNSAGIPDLRNVPPSQRKDTVEKIYDAFKGIMTDSVRRAEIRKVFPDAKQVRVALLGLWDTVESLGLPAYEENPGNPNARYGDQLCNVDKALHALSLDDDRFRAFTPILLTRKHLFENCAQLNPDSILSEVWFSGAHADVGGGYDDTEIDGVSLNWMLDHLRPFRLVPSGTRVYEAPLDTIHDPEADMPYMYRWGPRHIDAYLRSDESTTKVLKVHYTALDRIQARGTRALQRYESPWHTWEYFRSCFRQPQGIEFIGGADCKVERVDNQPVPRSRD